MVLYLHVEIPQRRLDHTDMTIDQHKTRNRRREEHTRPQRETHVKMEKLTLKKELKINLLKWRN